MCYYNLFVKIELTNQIFILLVQYRDRLGMLYLDCRGDRG